MSTTVAPFYSKTFFTLFYQKYVYSFKNQYKTYQPAFEYVCKMYYLSLYVFHTYFKSIMARMPWAALYSSSALELFSMLTEVEYCYQWKEKTWIL